MLTAVLCGVRVHALPAEAYASASVLESGRWVKVQVSSTGLYMIPVSTLRKWGFSNPANVRIHGYGGADISDVLAADTYIDDLPQVQTEVTDRGVVFYGVGPVNWPSVTGSRRLNAYSTAGYYFVTESDSRPARTVDPLEPGVTSVAPQTVFTCHLLHELDQVSPGATGQMLFGEEFVYTRSRTFNFSLDGYTGDDIGMRCVFLAKSTGASLSFAVNGTELPSASSDNIPSNSNAKSYGEIVTVDKAFSISGERLALDVRLNASTVPSRALLDYIDISYPRRIELDGGYLKFNSRVAGVSLAGGDVSTRVWDVTDPLDIKGMMPDVSGGTVSWINQYAGVRDYVAWNPGASLPTPVYVGPVANQNLHGLEPADMVIFAPAAFLAQAERLADIHRNSLDSLRVHVVDQEQVFNEFGSGMAHPNALRRMLKMMYDRKGDRPLKYALMFGRGSYDNRRLTQAVSRRRNMMPLWQSVASNSEHSSYTTDDIFGFLEDGSGLNIAADKLSIAVGRIPAANIADARTAVDKIEQYLNSMPRKAWKNRMVFLADDAGEGVHVNQTETLWRNLQRQEAGNRFIYDKIYIDAYERIDGGYPLGRTELYRTLNEGVLLWTYVGHGNPSSLTGDKMVMPTDISSLYLRQYPIFYAATCEFLRWDGDDYSGAEIMHFMADGGTIASICSTRLALISNNGNLTARIGDMFTQTDSDGRFLPLGEIFRRAKNNLDNEDNKLRYVLMGDPALRPAAPEAVAVLTHVNDIPLATVDQPTLKANQDVTFRGRITDAGSGEIMAGFDGTVNLCIYDADRSITTNGHVDEPTEDPVRVTFDQRGQLLYSGNARVVGGEFTLAMSMPAQIAENFRPATVSMYASSDASPVEAAGVCRDLYVYGYDEAVTDTVAPEISLMVLNHDGFRSGDNVNESPMLIARVSDDRGVNLSMSGVGHVMNITVDGTRTHTDVVTYYTPDIAADGRSGGSIAYQLNDLAAGRHTARLRVWDTSGNMAERTIEFNVVTGMAPGIYDVYTDANPATTQANFYVKHDRPDSRMTVTVTVYNLLGQPVWSSSATGRSDMFVTSPLTWDLTDGAGRRVPRGIYVYRATIATDGGESTSPGRKIAVAAR